MKDESNLLCVVMIVVSVFNVFFPVVLRRLNQLTGC